MNARKHFYYDEISSGYDELYSDEQQSKIKLILENISVSESDRVLDLGGGTGLLSDFVSADIVNLEPSKKMLDVGVSKNRSFTPVCGFAEDIGSLFKDGEFDFVFCLSSVHHFFDVEEVFSSINKVLKKDSIVVISFLKRADSTPVLIEKSKSFFSFFKLVEDDKDFILFFKNNVPMPSHLGSG